MHPLLQSRQWYESETLSELPAHFALAEEGIGQLLVPLPESLKTIKVSWLVPAKASASN